MHNIYNKNICFAPHTHGNPFAFQSVNIILKTQDNTNVRNGKTEVNKTQQKQQKYICAFVWFKKGMNISTV